MTRPVGLPSAVQDEVRNAARQVLQDIANNSRSIPHDIDIERFNRMMNVCVAEDVAPEYAPMLLEELGFVNRDVHWSTPPVLPTGFQSIDHRRWFCWHLRCDHSSKHSVFRTLSWKRTLTSVERGLTITIQMRALTPLTTSIPTRLHRTPNGSTTSLNDQIFGNTHVM